MNTVTDLRAELSALADRTPSDGDVRGALAGRIDARARRRRTISLFAAAVAVVVVAGGAGIAASVLSHRSAGPAAPTPVVSVPQVPLPADTKLIRHQLQAVTTRVTALPPKGLSGHMWMSAPGRLAVSFFDPGAPSDSILGGDASLPLSRDGGGSSTATAGYAITDQRDEKLQSFGPNGPTTVTVTHQNITIGGHAATLDTAPADTNDNVGFPASERITWQLPGGRWIHVWASGLGDKAAVQDFAAGITADPQTLDRTVGIGLTLAGLTVDSSLSSWPAVAYLGASVYLCPKGVDPMTASYSSSSGSGSSGPDGSSSSTETSTNQEPTSRCLTTAVMNIPTSQRSGLPTTGTVTVGDTIAHVDTKTQSAWTDLGDGATAIAGAPRDVDLSAADLAALVASVRLSPAATLIPMQISQGSAHSGGATVVSSAIAIPAPNTAATERPGKSAGSASSSAAIPPGLQSSMAANTLPAQDPVTAAAQRRVVTGYLDAVKARDCTAADRYFVDGKPQIGNGDLCHAGSLRLLGYRIDGAPATPSPDEAVFAVTITTTGGDGSIPDGGTTWFLDLHRQPSSDWLITGGGTGP